MNQTIEIDKFTAVEAFGKDSTTLVIRNLHEYELRLEISNDLADEIMEKLCKRLKGYYIEDKVSELEHDKYELEMANETLHEVLAEERLNMRIW